MELKPLEGDRFMISAAGLEWVALDIPVVRTNERPYPHGMPRHGWPLWPAKASPGRAEVIEKIRETQRAQLFPPHDVDLILERRQIPGLVEILLQNRRVEWNLPLVPRELVAQMISAIEAFDAGLRVPTVETDRIRAEWNALQWQEWGREEWSVSADGLTKRRAHVVAFMLKLLRLGNFSAADPRNALDLRLDYATAMRLQAALEETNLKTVVDYEDGELIEISPTQAREEMRDLLDIGDFLDHALKPGPEAS